MKLERFIQELRKIHKLNTLPEEVVKQVEDVFQWEKVAFFIKEEKNLSMRACYKKYVTERDRELESTAKEAIEKISLFC